MDEPRDEAAARILGRALLQMMSEMSQLIEPPKDSTGGLLSSKAACEYLDIGRTKLTELVKDGYLRPRLMSGRRMFERRDLDDFIDRLPHEHG